MPRRESEDGFTLIELLIVIVVLGILAAIVVFAVGDIRGSSVSATCRTDVRAITAAAEGIKASTDSYPADEAAFVPGALKQWPGGTVTVSGNNGNGHGHGHGSTISTADDVAFTFTGSGDTYSLGVYGRSMPGTVLTAASTGDDQSAACTTN